MAPASPRHLLPFLAVAPAFALVATGESLAGLVWMFFVMLVALVYRSGVAPTTF
jgi:hypothetical protein